MRHFHLIMLLLFCTHSMMAQTSPTKGKTGQKITTGSKKINEKTQEYSQTSLEASDNLKQSADNLKSVANNIKGVVMIFEPITRLHFGKKKNKSNNKGQGNQNARSYEDNSNTENPPPPPPGGDEQYGQSGDYSQNGSYPSAGNYGSPENSQYNADGTMNCGHQHNALYGNCIDLLQGVVLGMGEASENPGNIDLIFFSQYDGSSFSFYSPYEAANGLNEGNWAGIGKWRERNETEIAQTKMSLAQFEKIQTNTQLMNAVKNANGYAGNFYTSGKMDGRVFAVKLMQDNREVNALLAVYKQYGGGGSNGYLKIKIKVQGIDQNQDGYADPGAYNR